WGLKSGSGRPGWPIAMPTRSHPARFDPNASARRSRSALRQSLDGRGLSLPPERELTLVSADRARMQARAAELRGLPLAPERVDEFGKTCKQRVEPSQVGRGQYDGADDTLHRGGIETPVRHQQIEYAKLGNILIEAAHCAFS